LAVLSREGWIRGDEERVEVLGLEQPTLSISRISRSNSVRSIVGIEPEDIRAGWACLSKIAHFRAASARSAIGVALSRPSPRPAEPIAACEGEISCSDLALFSKRMMPVNRRGGTFCAPSKSLWETCFPFSTRRQDSPATFIDEGTSNARCRDSDSE